MFNLFDRDRKQQLKKKRLHVELYTRHGCHLCEIAHAYLTEVQERYDFTLEVRDVDANPEWAGRYNECVPVVVIDGKERFRGQVNPVLFRRIMRQQAG
jgi:glutaredoxin